MAIGLGEMFGFHLPENFNYPLSANTITDFWRRWHITLSKWFKDYIYIPLGGNRVSKIKTYSTYWWFGSLLDYGMELLGTLLFGDYTMQLS